MNDWLEDHKNLSKFEKEFLTELLNDIEKEKIHLGQNLGILLKHKMLLLGISILE
jgi:hypothetical protein